MLLQLRFHVGGVAACFLPQDDVSSSGEHGKFVVARCCLHSSIFSRDGHLDNVLLYCEHCKSVSALLSILTYTFSVEIVCIMPR